MRACFRCVSNGIQPQCRPSADGCLACARMEIRVKISAGRLDSYLPGFCHQKKISPIRARNRKKFAQNPHKSAQNKKKLKKNKFDFKKWENKA